MKRPADQERLYIEAVLATYSSLPGTPARPSRQDRKLARDLCRRDLPLRTVHAALLLAAARRTLRSGPPLPPVRTLHYFIPAVQEVLELPPNPAYVEYLAEKLRPHVAEKERLLAAALTSSAQQPRETCQISPVSHRR